MLAAPLIAPPLAPLAPLARSPPPRCLEPPPAGVVVTVLSGLAILGRPDSALWALFEGDAEPGAEAQSLTASLSRREGWDVSCEIGAPVARELGGSGELARGGGAADLRLDVIVAFEQSAARRPCGYASLLRPSRLLMSNGAWEVVAADEQTDAPTAMQWRLALGPGGLSAGGETLIAPGTMLYFDAAIAADAAAESLAAISGVGSGGGCRFEDGRISVLEDLGMGFSEFKVVGRWTAKAARRVE